MDDMGLGAGLAAMAFWGFVAAVVVGGIWDGIRKREAQHETVRRVIESGQTIDEALVDKLLAMGGAGSKRTDREFKVTALWLLPVSAGLAIFGVILSSLRTEVLAPMLGAAALCACLGVGCLIAAKITSRWYPAEDETGRQDLGA